LLDPINIFEYEQLASQNLTQMTWDYYVSGANDEITLNDNRAAFNRLKLLPQVLVDVSQRDLKTTILGQSLELPILIAPMAFQCLAHLDGELATAKVAARMGIGMVLSTLATKSIEEVAGVSDRNPLWFQLYVHKDRGLTRALVERAYASGFTALCLTVDAPLLGKRERDARNEFALPQGMELANLISLKDVEIPHAFRESGLFQYFASQLNPALTWKDLEWLQSITSLPLVIKGILRGDDAIKAVELGAKAIVVSNHGGRQLDGSIATIEALPEVVETVRERVEILVDGGIRRGTDILKALALGAKAVLIGRPILWGLAVNGEAGVRGVIDLYKDELDLAMALSGCAKLSDINKDLVRKNY
jgi:4-hydroxymandelate oxidase